jgi:hypothetical protein
VLVNFWQIVVVLVFLAIMVAWVVALVDAVRRPQAQWEMAQQNKLLFVLLIIFLGWFGALLYAIIPWPQLKVAAARGLPTGQP